MSTTPMVNMTIDGQALEVPQGSMIIEAADHAGFTIPRFCYHKKLSVAANCRMCLVEASNSKKPVPACATPVADGVIIQTKSPKALAAQKAVMEFLLINHPLDCPICDQGGECELQDLSMGYGKDVSRYNQGKRSIEDKNIGPLIQTELTRCIQCTRCVRFGAEIAGMREMGMIHRGEHAEIATFMTEAVHSELSGNVIDLCPVGALTNKPFRYQARAWEMQEYPLIAPHDCVGSNLFVHVRRGDVMRAVPRENEALNEVWLSDRDRYSVHALNSPFRATEPMIRKEGVWTTVPWLEALEYVVEHVNVVKKVKGPEKIAAFASASSTTEEFYLLQKLIRGIGSHNMDFRTHTVDFNYQYDVANFAGMDASLEEVAHADVILVFAGDLRTETPILNHRLRSAAMSGAQVIIFNPYDLVLNYEGTVHLCNFDEMTEILLHLLQEVAKQKPLTAPFMEVIHALSQSEKVEPWAALTQALLQAERPVILGGSLVFAHPEAQKFLSLFSALREALNAKGGLVTPGANTAGAWLAGYLPHRGPASKSMGKEGLATDKIFDPASEVKAYFLVNTEPGREYIAAAKTEAALKQADFVVSLSAFVTDYLKDRSDVILPIAAFTETAGSFINVGGQWQSWQGVAKPKGEARPLWKVLRVLGNLFGLPGFDYDAHEDIVKELRAYLVHMKAMKSALRLPHAFKKRKGMQRIGVLPMYATDMLSRHSTPLQDTPVMQDLAFIGLSHEQAKALGVTEGERITATQGEQSISLPAKIMRLAKNTVFLSRGLTETHGFGEAFGEIKIHKP